MNTLEIIIVSSNITDNYSESSIFEKQQYVICKTYFEGVLNRAS